MVYSKRGICCCMSVERQERLVSVQDWVLQKTSQPCSAGTSCVRELQHHYYAYCSVGKRGNSCGLLASLDGGCAVQRRDATSRYKHIYFPPSHFCAAEAGQRIFSKFV